MLSKRSVASVIIFSIITCGIYAIWWVYVTCSALQQQGGKTAIPPILTTLLILFFPAAGGALLGLDADDNINLIKARYGMPCTDNKLIWIILGLVIPIVLIGLIQNEINTMIDTDMRNRQNASFGL